MRPAPEMLDVNNVALFLDVDGTLLPIRDNPADVVADSELLATLEECSTRLEGAMALISGRSIAEVDRIFAPAVFPVSGAHGAELRKRDGCAVVADNAAFPQGVLNTLQRFVARHDRLLLERKRGGVSLHYRRAPELEAACRELAHQALDEVGEAYRLIAGKMVFEIAPLAHNKGAAIRSFLASRPFAGRRPLFVGDDVTDEDGFHVVNELEGVSIRVGEVVDSKARYRLESVEDVLPWLQAAILGQQKQTSQGDSCS